jgi:hypothetical protein
MITVKGRGRRVMTEKEANGRGRMNVTENWK